MTKKVGTSAVGTGKQLDKKHLWAIERLIMHTDVSLHGGALTDAYHDSKEALEYLKSINSPARSEVCKCLYESDCHGIEMIKSPSGKEWAIGGTHTKDRFKFCPWCGGSISAFLRGEK